MTHVLNPSRADLRRERELELIREGETAIHDYVQDMDAAIFKLTLTITKIGDESNCVDTPGHALIKTVQELYSEMLLGLQDARDDFTGDAHKRVENS